MTKFIKTLAVLSVLIAASVTISACSDDASIASRNLSKAADMFEIERRIVFYNGITESYILVIEGRCSLNISPDTLRVTCKTGPNSYKKHYLGISDNVTYFAEQMESKNVSVYHYRVIFKPQSILPDIDFRGDANALVDH